MSAASPLSPPRDRPAEALEATVERVVFRNDENGWAVLRLAAEGRREPITAVGRLLGLTPGERVRLTGEWVTDRKYGRQFRVESFMSLLPATARGIERYLGSGLVPGIGKVMAKRLVAAFGLETLEVIANEPEKLARVPGIGKVRSRRICEAWKKQRDVRDVMLFLQTHGISANQASRILKAYGARSVAAVRENPFRLAEDVFGIGFASADRIAESLGVARDSEQRLAAGALHALRQAADRGHLFLPQEVLTSRAAELLGIDEGRLGPIVDGLERRGEVVREPLDGPAGEPGGAAVYLPPLHASETGIAERLRALADAKAGELRIDVERALAWFESRRSLELAERQREAVRQALANKILVITGGPGTGKTTLVRALVEILTAKGQRLLLAAPTGRAAKRLGEATGVEVKTIHRLLEFDPRRGGFQRHAERPLEADLVLVDEASMVDSPLAYHLLDALPVRSRLVLVGDVDQLPSVGPGKVLADIIRSRRVPVVRLDRIFRQAEASRIVANAHRILHGEMPSLGREEPGSDFFFIDRTDPDELVATLLHLVTERIPKGFGLDPRADVQVLTPMRRGPLGADRLNQELQAALNPTGRAPEGFRRLRLGDRVMQIRNNYDLEVFNGDIGRVEDTDPTAKKLRVAYDSRIVEYEIAEQDELALAYACSIHKAQGSEYRCVVMPVHNQHYVMLRRSLVYTAVTRAQELMVLVGDRRALGGAVRNTREQRRYTWLAERLAGRR